MKTLICYSLGSIEPRLRTKFHRELYGYKDKSNHGRYNYERKGILPKGYKKPLDSVLVLRSKIRVVIDHLKRYNAKFVVYKVC